MKPAQFWLNYTKQQNLDELYDSSAILVKLYEPETTGKTARQQQNCT
jgi:hypothetical protein